ncbi:putative retrotransposon gag domain-containing protein [Helianthus annuus]|uniref:Retrotransposon gag domain-containing protein n=1 Tax=Helianthus annuus TaxID=4232 RepID=A0A9K3N470_HELAN|nr:putative retrotransposon gag domain-containing protein [Helianthus annuus]
MEINPIPERLKEACLCKGFGSTLTGSALKWLLSLPPYSITSFANLVNLFNNQFSCSRKFERLTSDLYRITQGHNESLRDYITKFSKESLDIPNLDIAPAVEAFKMGLLRDSLFYDDLVMTPCRNLDEVRTRALRFIRLEDDKRIQERLAGSSKQESKDPRSRTTNSNPITELTTRTCMLLIKKMMMRIILQFLNIFFR